MFGTNVHSRRRSRGRAPRVSAVEELRQGAAKELQLRRAWELRFGAAPVRLEGAARRKFDKKFQILLELREKI